VDHLAHLVHAFHARVAAGYDACTVELVGEHRVEDRVDQRGFAGAGDAGDHGEHAEREAHVDVLEVVLAGTHDFEHLGLVDLAALGGHGDLSPVGDVVAGDGALGFYEVLGGAGVDDFAAAFAGAGADVDHPVGAAYRVLVVFDDNQRVAEIAQVVQGFDEAFVVTLVQADGRLVEHVHDADQAGADLRGESDALRFSAGQGGGRAREGQVVEADVVQEAESGLDLLEHFAGDQLCRAFEFQAVDPGEFAYDGHVAHVEDGFSVHGDSEHFGLQAASVADLAGHFAHVRLVVFAHGLRIGFVVASHERADHAFEAGGVFAQASPAIAVGDVDLEVVAVEDVVLDVVRQALPRGLHGEAHFLGQTFEDVAVVLGGHLGAAPRFDDAVGQ